MDIRLRCCRLLWNQVSRPAGGLSKFPSQSGLRRSVQRCRFSNDTQISQTSLPHSGESLLQHVNPLETATVVPSQDPQSSLSTFPIQQPPTILPITCPGCGALTQDVDPGEAGFYTASRNGVKKYLKYMKERISGTSRPAAQADGPKIENGGDDTDIREEEARLDEHETLSEPSMSPPMCDRCHHLIHDSRGVPIAHPSVDAITDSIAESPFSKNHVFHVMDAADFPMSLIPSVFKSLQLARPRSQNRRSRHSFSSKPSLSFIITRSDLLAPSKDMVDHMMPKMISVLRTAMGRAGQKLRLGNVHLVSAKRGWWTKDIKEDIWKRGGGNWLVGKFNVGKSNLVEVLFPKGTGERALEYAERQQQSVENTDGRTTQDNFFSEESLLPPPQPEVLYPPMPLVSSLPGTTASPIRIPFGRRKGELIDMPGLDRGGLDQFVKTKHRSDLVMTTRPTVSQCSLKPGQSLLLGGGLVRITPVMTGDFSTTVLAYPFTPLKAHVTSTDKATEIQLQQRESGVESILEERAGSVMASAGRFKLQTDVTKSRARSIIKAGVDIERLPFRVYATDILIEGVGWVELIVQVRNNRPVDLAEVEPSPASVEEDLPAAPQAEGFSIDSSPFTPFGTAAPSDDSSASKFPEVEVFTPYGKSVGQRECLDLWQAWNTGKAPVQLRAARPRRSMSGAKRHQKMLQRAQLDQ